MLTVDEVADMLRVHVNSVYRRAADGTLPGLLPKVGSLIRVGRARFEAETGIDVAAWFQNRRAA